MRALPATAILLLLFLPLSGGAATALNAGSSGYHDEEVALSIGEGRTLRATIRTPRGRGKEGRKVPAILVFGGFETAARVLSFVAPPIPAITATFDYPFAPPRIFEFPRSLAYAPQARRAVRDMIAGMVALAAHLAGRDDVDPSGLSVLGASFGAPFALAGAALEPRLRNIILVHACANLPDAIAFRLTQSWKERLGLLAAPAAWLVSRVGWLYLDPPSPEESAAKLTPAQRVLLISARDDTILPHDDVEALWDALERSPAGHERVILPGDHVKPETGPLVTRLTAIAADWLRKRPSR